LKYFLVVLPFLIIYRAYKLYYWKKRSIIPPDLKLIAKIRGEERVYSYGYAFLLIFTLAWIALLVQFLANHI